ncbi:GDSL-like lipase/Acylhydrolase family protein [Sarocladium implicatum]|nr:GDSL-like lipase/Acylhydrolase family protein [Sarocladium implicatum]
MSRAPTEAFHRPGPLALFFIRSSCLYLNSLQKMKFRSINWLLLAVSHVVDARTSSTGSGWVTIWGTMPQLTEPANFSGIVFEDTTIRQTIMMTAAAESLRLEISNVFGGSDLPITEVTIALPEEQTLGINGIKSNTIQSLTFSGTDSFTVPNGAVVFSDPVDFPVDARTIITISIYLEKGQTTNLITGHPGSRTTSHLVHGNHVSDASFGNSTTTNHWYLISSIEGQSPEDASAVVLVGDSITDGRGSTTNGADRWPDQLIDRFQNNSATKNVAIVNQAAGGNRLLADGLGPNALGRIDRDVISHAGARYAVIYNGVNDIGVAATDEASQQAIGDRIVQAYDQMIYRLHRHGIAVYGATITPFTGPGQVYGDPNREVTRQRVNEWIRESGKFDAVFDFDEVIRDPDQPDMLLPAYDSGDYLHPNPEGFKAMAESIDLSLFE